jgi:hypothetical protein
MLTKAADPAKIPMRARLAMLLIMLEITETKREGKGQETRRSRTPTEVDASYTDCSPRTKSEHKNLVKSALEEDFKDS